MRKKETLLSGREWGKILLCGKTVFFVVVVVFVVLFFSYFLFLHFHKHSAGEITHIEGNRKMWALKF